MVSHGLSLRARVVEQPGRRVLSTAWQVYTGCLRGTMPSLWHKDTAGYDYRELQTSTLRIICESLDADQQPSQRG